VTANPGGGDFSEERETRKLLGEAAAGSGEAIEKLVKKHIHLVRKISCRFAVRHEEGEDIFQAGCLGLLKAIERFNPCFNARFSTYAFALISGEMRHYLRDCHSVSAGRSLREKAREIMKTEERLYQHFNRAPTIGEIAAASSLSREDIVAAYDISRETLSLNLAGARGKENRKPAEEIKDCRETEENWLQRIYLREAIASLKEKEKMTLVCRYFLDKTQSETAAEIGLSQAQISRLEKNALRRVKFALDRRN
jgi:RNA polymerase sporulation-specific sigma factor